jgi:hypothetical protein
MVGAGLPPQTSQPQQSNCTAQDVSISSAASARQHMVPWHNPTVTTLQYCTLPANSYVIRCLPLRNMLPQLRCSRCC